MIIFRLLPKVHIQLEPDSNKKKKNLDVWTTGSNISKQGSAPRYTFIISPIPQWVVFPRQAVKQTCGHKHTVMHENTFTETRTYMQSCRHTEMHTPRNADMQSCRHTAMHTPGDADAELDMQ